MKVYCTHCSKEHLINSYAVEWCKDGCGQIFKIDIVTERVFKEQILKLELALADKISDIKIKYDPKVVARRMKELTELLKL